MPDISFDAAESEASQPRPVPARPNLTEGPITRTLLLFSLPVLGGNVLQSLNGSVNQFWVSHSLGVTAITAIGNANIIMMLMLGSIFGVSMAANILIAQAVGAGNMDRIKQVMGSATSFFVALSLAASAVGVVAAPGILHLMGTPAEARAEAIVYLRIVFLAMPFMCTFVYLQMAQRGAGDSRTPFYFLLLAVVLDIILNPLLIRGVGPFPRLDIAGSAMSTFIGQGVSLAAMIAWLYRVRSPLMLRRSDLHLLKPDLAIAKALVLRGLPMGAQMLVFSGSAVIMIGMVNQYGALTAAAYTAASQVWTYLQMPAMALSGAISSMAAQNIGAGRWDRVGKIARAGVLTGLVVTGVVAAVIYALGDLTLHIFLPEASPALPVAHHINVVVAWSFVLFSVSFALSGVVRSTGAAAAPLMIMILSLWIIRLPFAHLLEPVLGADSIWWSFPLGILASALLNLGYYRYGGWRKTRMLGSSPVSGQAPDAGMAPPCMDSPIEDEVAEAAEHARRVNKVV